MHVASAGGIDREASFIYVYMRCACDLLKRGEGIGRDIEFVLHLPWPWHPALINQRERNAMLSQHICQFRNPPVLIANLDGKLVLLRQLFQRVADDSPRIHLFLGSIPRVRMTDANSAGQGLREDETDSA